MKILALLFYVIAKTINRINRLFDVKYDYIFVRRDRIGDFILWMGCAQKFRQNHQNSKICIICCKYNYEIVQLSGLFDEIVVINDSFFDFFKLFGLKCHELYISRQSRNYKENLIGLSVASDNKIAIVNDDVYSAVKINENRIYNLIIDIPLFNSPEISINTNFYNCSTHNNERNLYADLSSFSGKKQIDDDYFVLCIGSSSNYKNWPVDKFIELINRIYELNHVSCVLVGGKNDIASSLKVNEQFIGKIYNKVGKTTLTDLMSLISHSKYVISNDTSVVHISAAYEVRCFYICSGIHFERFGSYPSGDLEYRKNIPISIMDEYRPCFGCQMNRDLLKKSDIDCEKAMKNNNVLPCIENISVDKSFKIICNSLFDVFFEN